MKLRRTSPRAAIGIVGVLAVGLTCAIAPAAVAGPPGPGAVTVSPSTAVAGTPTTLEFSLDPRGLSHNGQITLTVPSGWTAPQTSDPAAAGYVSVVSAAGCTPTVSGNTITLSGDCVTGKSLTVDFANAVGTVAGASDFTTNASGAATRTQAVAGDATVTVTPGVPARLVFSQQPGDTGVTIEPAGTPDEWRPFDPPVAVTMYDAYGNLATGYPDHLSIVIGPNDDWNGTTTVTADPTTATGTFTGVADGSGGCEVGHMLKTMTVEDTDRGISVVSDPYCSRHDIDQGQLGGGG